MFLPRGFPLETPYRLSTPGRGKGCRARLASGGYKMALPLPPARPIMMMTPRRELPHIECTFSFGLMSISEGLLLLQILSDKLLLCCSERMTDELLPTGSTVVLES